MQLAAPVILEAAFSVKDIRGLFAVAMDAILRPLDTFPKQHSPPSPLTVRPEAVLLVRLVTPHGERLLLIELKL